MGVGTGGEPGRDAVKENGVHRLIAVAMATLGGSLIGDARFAGTRATSEADKTPGMNTGTIGSGAYAGSSVPGVKLAAGHARPIAASNAKKKTPGTGLGTIAGKIAGMNAMRAAALETSSVRGFQKVISLAYVHQALNHASADAATD